MERSYRSIYVMFYRWSFKNFGQGKLPQFRSLFNVSFLLIILLTVTMLLTQFIIRAHLLTLSSYMAVVILIGETILMLLNYFVLLNNKWFSRLNDRLSGLSKHNHNKWAIVLLVNVIITCGIFLLTI